MKKIYSLIFASSLILLSLNSKAATITVGVGVDATFSPANQFTPAAVTAVIGDVVQFILGNAIGFIIVATVLLPLYYKLRL